MNQWDFFDLVRMLRKAQKEHDLLINAHTNKIRLDFERRVDAAIVAERERQLTFSFLTE